MPEPGTLACGGDGTLLILIGGERYRIDPADARRLIFFGGSVAIRAGHRRSGVIAGRAALNPPGRAVVLRTAAGEHVMPLAAFRRVARGEMHAAPLHPCSPG
ncbi:MAG: hypothetical protein KO206_04745 [Methanomicrobiaceae archaeon]|nr:hypothetical protein [Methanomicrobiaceae archaeon]MDD5419006.1 hypothetical protein [Methanomicrobiaceae archaeon]